MNQDVLVVLATARKELNITNVCDYTQGAKHCLSTSKDQIVKARSPGIKCVSLLDINFHSSSSTKLLSKVYKQLLSHLYVVMKKIY